MATLNMGLLKKYTREMSVLLVEDDNDFREELFDLLQDIFPNVSLAYDGQHALDKYHEYYYSHRKFYDLVLSDLKMPNIDGIELINQIYKMNSKQIIVILSACNDFSYLLPLLNLGIEQFFPKPIKYTSFSNDIMKICHKIYTYKYENNKDHFVTINDFLTWDKQQKALTSHGKNVKLTKKELLLLETLLKEKDRIYTADELIRLVWFDNFESTTDIRNLKNVISRLRKKIPSLYIKNIYGLGYKIDFTSTDVNS